MTKKGKRPSSAVVSGVADTSRRRSPVSSAGTSTKTKSDALHACRAVGPPVLPPPRSDGNRKRIELDLVSKRVYQETIFRFVTYMVIRYIGYPSLHDALANNNVHDSNRLQNHTPRNLFRHLKQQRKHYSVRPSHQATQHAQKQTTQQTTQLTRRPHSRHVPDGFCRENHVVKVFFSKFAHPHHCVYLYFTACRLHTDFFRAL